MALISNEDQGNLSSYGSQKVLDREAKGNENAQDLSMEQSLHQVQSAHFPHTGPIPPILEAEFKPTARLYLAFGTLAVITLMVALDGTSLSVALPVGYLPYSSHSW